MNYIKKLDIFGKEFYFTTYKQPRYATIPGVLLTLLIVLLFILVIFYFGVDFYNKTNPLVNYQNVPGQIYTHENLTTKNFFLPWAITDSANNILNISNLIYPEVTYFKYVRLSDGNYNLTFMTDISYQKCDKKYESIVVGSSKFNCLDFTSLNSTIGGGWDGEFVEYFTLNLFYCPGFGNYDPKGNCTSFEDLSGFLDNNYPYFTIFYPSLHFISTNLSNPLQLQYVNFFTQLNLGLKRKDTFKFQKSVLYDDQGWLISENNTKTMISNHNLESSYTLFPVSMYNNTNTNSIFYSAVFYFDKNYNLYSRSFMKIQNLAATVGGIMSALQIIFSGLYSFINVHLRDISLMNQIFEFADSEKLKSVRSKKSFLAMNRPSIKRAAKMESIKNKDEIKLDDINIEENECEKINEIARKFLNLHDKPPDFNPSISLILKDFLFCSKLNQLKDNETLEIHNICKEFVGERLDIIHYLRGLEILEIIKQILLNYPQSLALEFMNKPNLMMKDDLEVIRRFNNPEKTKQIEEIIKYFRERKETESFSDTDKKIFDSLDYEIKGIINEKPKKSKGSPSLEKVHTEGFKQP